MTVKKPIPNKLLRPITTGANSATNQSEFLASVCNLLKAREKSREQGANTFGFRLAHWLKIWRDIFKPITKRSNRNRVTTFDIYLKTAPFGVVSRYWCSDLPVMLANSGFKYRSGLTFSLLLMSRFTWNIFFLSWWTFLFLFQNFSSFKSFTFPLRCCKHTWRASLCPIGIRDL